MINKQLTLRISEALIKKLKNQAGEFGVSVNTLVENLLESSSMNSELMKEVAEKIDINKSRKTRKNPTINNGMKKVILSYLNNGKKINQIYMLADFPKAGEFIVIDFKEYKVVKVSYDVLYTDSVDVLLEL